MRSLFFYQREYVNFSKKYQKFVNLGVTERVSSMTTPLHFISKTRLDEVPQVFLLSFLVIDSN